MKSATALDDLDRRIITEMRDDPRISYATLGERLGVAAMTVRTRMNRLRARGILRIVAHPDLAQLGLGIEVLGLVQADVSAIPKVIDVLRTCPATLRADRIAGEYDISFVAAFVSQRALGDLLHTLQFEGVRRVVVHHKLDTAIDNEGWEAAFHSADTGEARMTVEARGAVEPHLRADFETASAWWEALGNADFDALRRLSHPEIVYTIQRPQRYAGVMNGLDDVLEHSRSIRKSVVRLRREVVRVTDSDILGYTLTIDALGTVETLRGRAHDLFGRLAFRVEDGLVSAALSLAEMDLPSAADQAS